MSNDRNYCRKDTYKLGNRGVGRAYARVLDLTLAGERMIARRPVRVCRLLVALALISYGTGTNLQAQVGISSGAARVSLVVRAGTHASMPALSAPREIGRRGELREAAIRIHLLANRGYHLVARSNAGSMSRVWIHMADDEYQELVPGRAVTLPRDERRPEREVRYMTDGSTASADLPMHFELVLDPVI